MIISSKWVLPVIKDIIEFAHENGHAALESDLRAIEQKHFSSDITTAEPTDYSNVIQLRKTAAD